jgi:hypothetical protein
MTLSSSFFFYTESQDRAPKLLKCRQLCGGWNAVFMEISDYTPLYGMELTEEEKDKVRLKMKNVVMDLHPAATRQPASIYSYNHTNDGDWKRPNFPPFSSHFDRLPNGNETDILFNAQTLISFAKYL